jgi:hypothetical protein
MRMSVQVYIDTVYVLSTEERLFIAHTVSSTHENSFRRKKAQPDAVDSMEAELLAVSTASVFIPSNGSHGKVFDDILLRDVIDECELKADNTDPPDTLQVIFRTEESGNSCGRSYIFRSRTQDAIAWDKDVDEAVSRAKSLYAHKHILSEFGHSPFALARARMRLVYESSRSQLLIAVIIVLGFIQDVIESSLQAAGGHTAAAGSPPSTQSRVFLYLECCFTLFYTCDLALNIFVHSDKGLYFWTSFYNWIDAGVVVVSFVALALTLAATSKTQIGLVKMVRIVRVLKLAKHIKEIERMHRMLACLASSVVPLCNAFLLLMTLTVLYAVVGTAVLGERSAQYFGSFRASLFSLFQVLLCPTPKTLHPTPYPRSCPSPR